MQYAARLLERFFDKPVIETFPPFWIKTVRGWRPLATRAQKYWLTVVQFDTAVSDVWILSARSGIDINSAFAKMDRPFAEGRSVDGSSSYGANPPMALPGGLFFLDDKGKTSDIPTPEEYQKRIRDLENTIDRKGRSPTQLPAQTSTGAYSNVPQRWNRLSRGSRAGMGNVLDVGFSRRSKIHTRRRKTIGNLPTDASHIAITLPLS